MNNAAFRATYADWKVVKTRGVIQVVMEVPLAEHDEAYKVLGGMPNPAAEKWFGIARLTPEAAIRETKDQFAEDRPRPSTDPVAGARKWDEMSPAQQAGILCADKSFQRYVSEDGVFPVSESAATEFVYGECHVDSRAQIRPGTLAAEKWRALVDDYRAWQREPEVLG